MTSHVLSAHQSFAGEGMKKFISKLMIVKAYGADPMPRGSVDMNFLFTLAELQRLVRAYADKQAARYGITRAQWAVLAKVERFEGLKQSELAEQMEMQPITLTRLIDRLCENGWIERRSDDADRRVNRLYLRKAARPLLGKLSGLRSELTATAMEGINPSDAHRLLTQLELIKENVRNAIQSTGGDTARKEQRYG
jgi:MarR family transcriptional regulator, transcriptional regulator for hemolysin